MTGLSFRQTLFRLVRALARVGEAPDVPLFMPDRAPSYRPVHAHPGQAARRSPHARSRRQP
ncbi:hypothetical protein DAETH_41240 (plasmid) [Deinococcus aetherius]|uniref:Uncharacterized protein n=1 Tax=Deinococcus aetherius TaxID=200252 RepID=A0ABM8AK12_9DEIO|nr:hypothetical protein [Deinococcus aetherius]BDP44155.1 hypothetical protein DAETH_41240 [Deinococcus aetherius]